MEAIPATSTSLSEPKPLRERDPAPPYRASSHNAAKACSSTGFWPCGQHQWSREAPLHVDSDQHRPRTNSGTTPRGRETRLRFHAMGHHGRMSCMSCDPVTL